MTKSPAIVEFLSRPDAYPEAPRSVEIIETHISWIFLTDAFAYKLKKPVAFDFLDFRTPELRRAACQEEVRLNRRLAADVYLGVLPITASNRGGFELAGSGQVVDWVVKMRRIPAERSLDRLIAAAKVTENDVERLAQRLADFYRELPPLAIEPAKYRRQIETHVRANRRDLLHFAGEIDAQLVQRVHGGQLQFLLLAPKWFDERLAAGRIVDGHGDLRPEHVYFDQEPLVIDCIEFNAEYRRIDVLDELGFLAMECDRLGAAEIGQEVLRRCAALLSDDTLGWLLAFYKSYRACVRAKVAALRGSQHEGSTREAAFAEARAYLDLARREATPLERPLVVLVRGLSGVGKSTVAAALAETLGAQWLATDLVRNELLGDQQDKYRVEHRAAVYEELFRRAEMLLDGSQSVVLDGTFLKAEQCRRAASLAQTHSALFLIVECHCPEEVARRRIADRLAAGPSASDAFPELHEQQRREQVPLPGELAACEIDTTRPIDESTATILERLRQLT